MTSQKKITFIGQYFFEHPIYEIVFPPLIRFISLSKSERYDLS